MFYSKEQKKNIFRNQNSVDIFLPVAFEEKG